MVRVRNILFDSLCVYEDIIWVGLKVLRLGWNMLWQMTTAIAIEDVQREVKILKALTGHHNLVRFYDACEDGLNVYIVME